MRLSKSNIIIIVINGLLSIGCFKSVAYLWFDTTRIVRTRVR